MERFLEKHQHSPCTTFRGNGFSVFQFVAR
jgi:hypothetical protein